MPMIMKRAASHFETLSAVSGSSTRVLDFAGAGGFVDTARKLQERC
jgi:hypothetical protein